MLCDAWMNEWMYLSSDCSVSLCHLVLLWTASHVQLGSIRRKERDMKGEEEERKEKYQTGDIKRDTRTKVAQFQTPKQTRRREEKRREKRKTHEQERTNGEEKARHNGYWIPSISGSIPSQITPHYSSLSMQSLLFRFLHLQLVHSKSSSLQSSFSQRW